MSSKDRKPDLSGLALLRADILLFLTWDDTESSWVRNPVHLQHLFLYFFFFDVDRALKIFIESVTTFLLFCVWGCSGCSGVWDLRTPTRGWAHTPCLRRGRLHHWAAREVPSSCLKQSHFGELCGLPMSASSRFLRMLKCRVTLGASQHSRQSLKVYWMQQVHKIPNCPGAEVPRSPLHKMSIHQRRKGVLLKEFHFPKRFPWWFRR